MSVNRVILIGNVGKDPEVKYLDNNVAVAKFTLATSESYLDSKTNERKETTEWHNIVAWRGLAEVAQKYITKGKQIYVEGKITTRSWEKEGQKFYATDIVAQQIMLLGKKDDVPGSYTKPQTDSTQSTPAANPVNIETKDESSDLPF